MSRATKLLLLIVFSSAMVGCAAPASRDAMDIPSTDRTQYSASQFLSGKVAVASVIGGQETNPAWTSEIGNDEFKAALHNSLETAYLLSPDPNAEFELSAELIEIDQPMFGFTYTVKSTIQYQLRKTSSRETVLDTVINADGTASTGDAFAGVKRLRIATERSARANIQQIIEKLYRYEEQ